MGAKGPSPFLAVFLCVCSVCAELKISVISPVTATLGSDAFLECTFIVDKFPVDLKYLAIFWSFNGKELLRFVHGLKVLEPRASINETEIENGDASLLMSSVTVHDEGVYKCSVIYSPTKRQEFVTLTPQARPEIFIPQREAIIGKEALLRCCALGFYPVEIDIAWLRDGQILPGTSTSKPQQYANGTFRINSTVALLPAYSDAHLIFSCRVQHASLPGPLQEDIQLLLEGKGKAGRYLKKHRRRRYRTAYCHRYFTSQTFPCRPHAVLQRCANVAPPKVHSSPYCDSFFPTSVKLHDKKAWVHLTDVKPYKSAASLPNYQDPEGEENKQRPRTRAKVHAEQEIDEKKELENARNMN